MSAWTVISHTELTGSQANITLSSIPQTYDDLCLVLSLRSARGSFVDAFLVKLNNVTPAMRTLLGDGASAVSTTSYNAAAPAANATSNTFSNDICYIPNYASTTQAKSFSIDSVMENNATDSYQIISASLDSNTAAVTSIVLSTFTANNFVQYSSATLYGITKGSSGGVSVS